MYTVYLLHFSKPYWNTSRHYVGYTNLPVQERIRRHIEGKGSSPVGYAVRHGNYPALVFADNYSTQYEARQAEVRLKKSHKLSKWCSVCK